MNRSDIKIDMTEGPLLGKIIKYSLPVMATGMLQYLYNAADTAVVGQFAADSETALASVGATGALYNLLTGVFLGIGVGVSAAAARAIGAKNESRLHSIVQTAVFSALFLGLFVACAGFFAARPLLVLMRTEGAVLEGASLYLRTVMLGIPAVIVYNFGSAVLSARGDTRHPLYFLFASGTVNLLLNLFLVVVCRLDVLGVAIATVASQYVSCFLVVRLLTKLPDGCRFDPREFLIDRQSLRSIVQIGLPAGIQTSFFSLSNVFIQASINSFGKAAISANTAAAQIDGLIYFGMISFCSAALAFTSQNVGAGRFDRVRTVFLQCTALVTLFGVIIAAVCYLFGPQLLSVFGITGTPETSERMRIGMLRLTIFGLPYFTCGIMEVLSSMLRGLGASLLSAATSLVGACVLRIVWIYTVFAHWHTLDILYLSFPVSWVLVSAVDLVIFIFAFRRRAKSAASTGGASQ